MDIKIVGTANLQQMRAQFKALQMQVAELNKDLAATAIVPGRVNPQGYANMQRQVARSSQTFRDAAASTGEFYTQQVRLNSASERYTDLLKREKLGLSDLISKRKQLKAAYRDQIAMQNMTVTEMRGKNGKNMYDLAVPTNVSSELDTIGNRLGWVAAQTKSASRQMVNWGKNTQWAGRQLMVGFTMPVAAFGAATGVLAYQVDKNLTEIAKVYDTTAVAVRGDLKSIAAADAELAQVRIDSMETARKAAKDYGQTVNNTLTIEKELAATGLSGGALQRSTIETSRISQLGGLEVEQATNMTVALQTAFRDTIKTTDDLSEAFNFMNAAENATSLTIQDIAEATPRAASAMSALGVSVEQMTVMLVSMRESGVDAAEAANALKSATGSVLAPSPAADDFIKQISGGRVEVMKLAEASGGNLYKAMEILFEQMNGLSALQKQQILVKMFGKYQFNRVSAMLYNFGDAVNGVSNQTSTAMGLMETSAEDLAFTANRELGEKMKSASGKFQAAWASMQIDLSELGEPFLEVGTRIMEIVGGIISWFNRLPDGVKNAAAAFAIFMAAVGPLVMIGGLFANFVGNIGLLTAAIMSMGTKFRVLSKEEWTLAKASEIVRAGFNSQTTAVEALNKQVNALTLAAQEARKSVVALSNTNVGPLLGNPAGGTKAAGGLVTNRQGLMGPIQGPTMPYPIRATQSDLDKFVPMQYSGKEGPLTHAEYVKSNMPSNKAGGSDAQRLLIANERTEKKILQTTLQSVKARDALFRVRAGENKLAELQRAKEVAITKANEKGAAAVSAASLGTAAMAASTIMMVQPWFENVQNLGQYLMLATLVVPAVKGIGVALSFVNAKTLAMAASMRLASANAQLATGATTRWGAATTMAKAGISGVGKGIYALLGPIGIATAALTAVGFVAYKWYKHEQKITAEKEKQNRALYEQNNLMEDALKIQPRELGSASNPSIADGEPGMPSVAELTDQMEASDEMQAIIDKIKDAETETEKSTAAMQKYMQVLEASGGNASKAQLYIESLFRAAGEGALTAENRAMDLRQTLGDYVSPGETTALWSSLFTQTMNDSEKSAKEQGTALGKIFSDAVHTATNAQTPALMTSLETAVNSGWPALFKELDDAALDNLSNFNVSSGEEFKTLMDDYNAYVEGAMTEKDFAGKYEILDMFAAQEQLNAVTNSYEDQLDNLGASEKAIVKHMASALGIEKDITTLKELQNTYEWRRQTVTKANAKALYDQRVMEMTVLRAMNPLLEDMNDTERLKILNQIRASLGLKEATSLTQGLGKVTSDAADEANRIKKNIDGIPKKTRMAFQFDGADDWKKMLQAGMEGVQSDIADRASEQFNRIQDARISSAKEANEAAMDALDRRQEAATEAFEKRWERRREGVTAYWDARIDKIDTEIAKEQKAEEIRQRIFDAEMARLDRLNEASNRNIDFNVALNSGEFDEAAKIRNDMDSAANQWRLEDAAAVSERRAAGRVERMENNKDDWENAKDKALEALDDRENAERKHLDRVQEMRKDALEKQSDQEISNMENMRDKDRKNLDNRLELFKAYTARNQQDLERWMTEVGLSYDDFGISVKGKGEEWSKYFRTELSKNVRKAGTEIANDAMWKQMGNKTAKDLIGGALDMSFGQFKKWMMTGEFKTGGYKPGKVDFTGKGKKNKNLGGRVSNSGMGPQTTLHTGGMVGDSVGSRKGVARTQKGLHPSERLALLQKGEYVWDRTTTKQNKDLIEGVHSGRINRAKSNTGDGVGGPGIAGVMTAMIGNGIRAGVQSSINNKIDQMQAAQSVLGAVGGIFGAGDAGMYSDRTFSAEQLKNAATIASVGSGMGMSARDIMIGIMTAITESGLVNVNHGDRDSLGLFQQRPSQGWGTPEQVTDPIYAARKFFEGLKGVSNRGDMSPWLAAQAVQRSFDPTGTNYKVYWDNAQAIFKDGLSKTNNGGYKMVAGKGGYARPSVPGKGWRNSHDYGNGENSPLYAFNDGKVVQSRAVTSGGSPGNGLYSTPYRSYGEIIEIRGVDGNEVLYGHLAPGQRFVNAGDTVKGGQLIGLSGNTGNSTGPHTHFEWNGSEAAMQAFAANGIGLKTGGFTKSDGIANLHKNEVVVDPLRTKDLFNNLDALTSLVQSGWMLDPLLTAVSKVAQKFGRSGSSAGSDDQAGSTPTGSGGAVNSGTYNVLKNTTKGETQSDLARLMGKTDVLSLQEMRRVKNNVIPWIKDQGWGYYGGNGAGAGIAWNKEKYKASELNQVKLTNHRLANNYAMYGKFSPKDGGSSFYQGSAHTIWRGGAPAGQQEKIKMDQYNAIGRLADRLGSGGTPVIMGGDFNLAGTPISTLEKILGMKSNRKGGVDHLFYNNGIRGGKTTAIGKGMNSDHDAIVSSFQLPEFKTGGFIMKGGLARLHDDELVASKPITKDIVEGARNFANGGNSEYNVEVNLYGTDLNVNDVANTVVKAIKRANDRKPGSKKDD